MTYSIEKVTTLIGARRFGESDGTIAFLLTDSRSLSIPEETLFFALKTQRNDGHNYIQELYRRGVRNFVVERIPVDWQTQYADANFLKVTDTRSALQRLAERHRDEFSIPIVGITGSNGKTVVKEWLYQLLSPECNVTRSPRSYNSQIGVPLSVWLLNEHTQLGLFEAGISQPGEMEALRNIIQPTIGLITNIGPAHQEGFSSIEAKCMEKLLLFREVKKLVYCQDDPCISSCLERMDFRGERFTWSAKDPCATVYLNSTERLERQTRITYTYAQQQHTYLLPFVDDASTANSMNCVTTCLLLGMTPEAIATRIISLEPVAMRLEVKRGQNGCTLINDSYNSDINSLDIALDFMHRRGEPIDKRLTLVLSDIHQSGETPDKLYSKVSEMARSRHIDKFIGIGPALCQSAQHIDIAEKYFFPTTDAFVRSDAFKALHNEIILLKGARNFCFDQLTELLSRKVHETTLEVNLSAMVANLNHYRAFLKPDTKLVCMIKADGYGTGAVEIAKTLQDHRVDYLAVAVADEGVTLRRTGITQNIMVMNPEMTAFKTMFDNDLEPEVYSFRLLDALIKAAEKEGITESPIHIKIDTGMHRLGFHPENDMAQLIERLKRQKAVIPRSIFSHFVGSDSIAFDDFSAEQFHRFEQACRQLQAAFPHKILLHMDNSAGISHFPERQLDMCRLGIGLYGIDPTDNHIINNVSTLKTTILQLREVVEGETVGYSRRGSITHDSVIAAIPIGYADGLDRHLGNRRCYCLVNGQRADYVGNICMDVAMIDVTGIDCKEGDSVEIFGDNLPVTVLSDALDTLPYEVLTGISNRVKRVYYSE